jgi:hypothetical protein
LETPEHTYLKIGNYVIKLKVSDGQAAETKECVINAAKSSDAPGNSLAGEPGENGLLRINELLPNPDGADADGEWIELYNYGQVRINMRNWRLDDGEIGAPYAFAENFWLEAGRYLVLEREETRLALNNDSDTLRLFNSDNKQADMIGYAGAKERLSYARGDNGKWRWTIKPTPGETNEILTSPTAVMKKNGANAKKTASNQYVAAGLEKLNEYSSGDKINTVGQVVVLPGIFGTQYFYIAAGNGLQVYNYKKDFPALKIGDIVRVSGEISEINGEKRLKTKSRADIVVAGNKPIPAPATTSADKIDDNLIGVPVALSGEVVDVKGSTIFLDDGTGEAEVYVKTGTGISVKSVKAGAQAEITGIPSKTKTGIRIMPRFPEDIIIKDDVAPGKVLGAAMENDEWLVAPRDKKTELFKYLLAIAVTVIFILAVLMVKYKRENQAEIKSKN